MEQPTDAGFVPPTDDAVDQPVVTRSEIGFGIIDTPWWVVFWKGLLLSL